MKLEILALPTLAFAAISACSATNEREPRGGSGSSGSSGSSGGSGTAGSGAGVSVAGSGGIGVNPSGECPAGSPTRLSGTVYDPAGKTPLYNVVVFVPKGELPAIPEGVTCDRCSGATTRASAAALSDSSGRFVMENVPAGTNVPLVLQVGKWRREVVVPEILPCQDNPLTDVNLTRLPRNQGEGRMPQIAMSTGHSDALECLLRKIGIDEAEFTTETGTGRVHMFVGCLSDPDGEEPHTGANRLADGTMFPKTTTLYADPAKLDKYDMVVLSCEGHRCEEERAPEYMTNMKAYADKGGKLFLDHMHFYWLSHSEHEWEQAADIAGVGTDLPDPQAVKVETAFEKGASFADWLVNVGASATRGELSIRAGQYSIRAARPPTSQRWIYLDAHPTDGDPAVQYMTINTPLTPIEVPVDQQCGRLVYTDLHVAAGAGTDSSDQEVPFPNGCQSTELSPQEKALEFMIFDLSSCVQQEDDPVRPPVIIE